MFRKMKAWIKLIKAIKQRKPMKEIMKLIDIVNNFYGKSK